MLYIGFLLLIFALLALDLGVLNRKAHEISIKEAIGWTFFWIGLAMIFNLAVYFMYENHWMGIGKVLGHELTGHQAALQYLIGKAMKESKGAGNPEALQKLIADKLS